MEVPMAKQGRRLVTDFMPLTLVMEGETLQTTWAQFAVENDLDDYPEWRDEIRTALATDGVYHGGGGAQPEYSLRVNLI
jgi:hypothetical protein